MQLPRIMIAAPASGSGKTMVTCGLLQAFINRGLDVASFKCGPDYIDPLFHTKVIKAKSKNLDTFFCDEKTLLYLFGTTASQADLSLMEGVMGYYDGLGGTTTTASSYELASVTNTPAILVINCKGMSLSLIPLIQGFLQYKQPNHIKGVILNQMSQGLYQLMKPQIEQELGIQVFGYVPYVKELVIESRHLGLVLPEELEGFQTKLNKLAALLEETLALDDILQQAKQVPEITYHVADIPKIKGTVRIAVAKDEAFCFYYEDNLELLRRMGAELVWFSPLHDKTLPERIQGVLLGGGYPELTAKALSDNGTMRQSIRNAWEEQMPFLAECGGFMYLHEQMEGNSGTSYPMVGALAGRVYKTSKLNRFGYITLTAKENQMLGASGDTIKAHEFHYFDSDNCGDSFTACKPVRKTTWECIHGNHYSAVGFPHLYYYANTQVPYGFLNTCLDWKKNNEIRKSITPNQDL